MLSALPLAAGTLVPPLRPCGVSRVPFLRPLVPSLSVSGPLEQATP